MDPLVCENSNLSFLEQSIELTVRDNIATVSVGYFIENSGNEAVSDVFNLGSVSFSDSFIIDNIRTDTPDLITITQDVNRILYEGNLGNLEPGETILIVLEFDIVGVTEVGNYLINNVTNIIDGQNDCNFYVQGTILEVVEIDTSVKYKGDEFLFIIANESDSDIRFDIDGNIITPSNACFIFNRFTPFEAVYNNTKKPVPTNTPICKNEIIDISASGMRVTARSKLVFRIPFELVSSSQIGRQFIVANITSIRLIESDNSVMLLKLPDKYDSAAAEISMRIE